MKGSVQLRADSLRLSVLTPSETRSWVAQFALLAVSNQSSYNAGDGSAQPEENSSMAAFLFSYRVPNDYTPRRPRVTSAWTRWFESMGSHVVDANGNPCSSPSTIGDCGTDTTLAGYSLVNADDLNSALALAKGCPSPPPPSTGRH